MFDYVGSKLKTVSKIVCGIGILCSVIAGIIFMAVTEPWDFGAIYFFIGIAIAALGSVIFWAASLVIYGFGELIEKVSSIEENIPQIENIASAILSESRKIGVSPNAEQKYTKAFLRIAPHNPHFIFRIKTARRPVL